MASDWQSTILPRGDENSPQVDSQLRTSHWLSAGFIARALGHGEGQPEGTSPILLGSVETEAGRQLVSFDDDRHMVTVAGSRSGKGVSLLIPNLLTYRGSVIVTDPKGELAAVTGKYRQEVLKQRVVILDPFSVLETLGITDLPVGKYNPLQWLSPDDPEFIDDVSSIAEAMVLKETGDQHWSESALSYLRAIILYGMTHPLTRKRFNLVEMRKFAMTGENGDGVHDLIATLVTSQKLDGAIANIAGMFAEMGEREFGSVLSTVGRNTNFLDGPAMASTLSGESSFDPRTIKTEPTTIYLVLPEWRMASHSRWLRLVVSSLLGALQRSPRPKGAPATLMLLDEFASLGHMESIERAAAYIAGFGVKLWTVLQDLSQLKALYSKRWETFLGNAGLITAFGNADTTTSDYLSKRCGEMEALIVEGSMTNSGGTSDTKSGLGAQIGSMLQGGRLPAFGSQSKQESSGFSSQFNPKRVSTPLITADEISVHFARETGSMLALINGARPMRLKRLRYFDDGALSGRAAPNPYYVG